MLTWIAQNRKLLQLGLLVLLLASFLGPWTFEADGMPPPEWCDAPDLLLTPESCVRLVPGYKMVSFGLRFLVELQVAAFTASITLAEALQVILLILVVTLPVLPLVVLLWQVLNADRPLTTAGMLVLYTSLFIGWLAALLPVVTNFPPRAYLFWGLWLYLILSDATLMLNILIQITNSRAEPQMA